MIYRSGIPNARPMSHPANRSVNKLKKFLNINKNVIITLIFNFIIYKKIHNNYNFKLKTQ